jgi:hypothetical protein
MRGEMKGWLETRSLAIVILALTSHNICSRTSFLRADTKKFRPLVTEWMDLDIVSEWKGKFTTDDSNGEFNNEFFGLPSQPPFMLETAASIGSPMRCHRHFDEASLTRRVIFRASSMIQDVPHWHQRLDAMMPSLIS